LKRLKIKSNKSKIRMKTNNLNMSVTKLAIAVFTLALVNVGCKKNSSNTPISGSPKGLENFYQVNLVANNATYNAARIDTLLKDAWGISFSPAGNIWLSANATGYAKVYDKEGNQLLSPVSIPTPVTAGGGLITGQVFSGSANFLLPNGSPAIFIFATQDGIIAGWNKGNITNAIKKINNSATASYFGLALASNMGANYLYAANFKQATIDVFDNSWNSVNMKFTDPNLPAQYSPFNIQKIDNQLYVLYAKVGADGNEIHAAGLGIVDIFNTDGSFVKRFISNGELNSPWGIAKAPNSFFGADTTALSNTILVGNFGDGHINAYNANGTFLGAIQSYIKPLVIDGLWAISFAPVTATNIDPNRLYFEAGPNTEKDGLFGYLNKK
jgi:uncharacterized protein (TIGR03118 family)